MTLNNRQKKQYRAIGHQLSPVVTVSSKGVTEAVLAELDRALGDHELVKIKIALEREERKQALATLVEKLGAETVQAIGNRALLYRPAKKPDPRLSNLLRKDIFTE